MKSRGIICRYISYWYQVAGMRSEQNLSSQFSTIKGKKEKQWVYLFVWLLIDVLAVLQKEYKNIWLYTIIL